MILSKNVENLIKEKVDKKEKIIKKDKVMSINSINIAYGASWGAYNQKLTRETKAQLEALGIPFDPNITEKEGRALLLKAQSAKNSKNAKNENSLGGNSSSKNNLFEMARSLALKLGINIEEKMPFEALLNLIEDKIKERIESNQNNAAVLGELKNYAQELSSIRAQSSPDGSNSDSLEKDLMKSLEIIGSYNKNFLNRN